MFQRLQSRIILAFGFVILLAVAVSGWLAIRATTNEFDLFVTEEGFAQAEDIAVYLEAAYNYRGEFGDIEALLQQRYGFADAFLLEEGVIIEEVPVELEFFEENPFEQFFEWDQIIADELDLSFEEFQEMRVELSIADIAFEQGVDVEQLISAVMTFERENIGVGEGFQACGRHFVFVRHPVLGTGLHLHGAVHRRRLFRHRHFVQHAV